jgi:ABC-type antimicrobial peptide transport system permease subunit
MQTARIVRGEVLALKEREFVLAARSIGTPSRRMILRHILPNVLSPIMVSATLGIATAIITESRCRSWASAFRRISRPGAGCCSMRSTTCSSIPSGCSGRVWRFR